MSNPLAYIQKDQYIFIYLFCEKWKKVKIESVKRRDKEKVICNLSDGIRLYEDTFLERDNYGIDSYWYFEDNVTNNIIYGFDNTFKKLNKNAFEYAFLFSMFGICVNNFLLMYILGKK